jgi:hypothetical protein
MKFDKMARDWLIGNVNAAAYDDDTVKLLSLFIEHQVLMAKHECASAVLNLENITATKAHDACLGIKVD